MIKNERQYRITKAQVRRFEDAVAESAGRARTSNISPRLWDAQREAARSQIEELREQVDRARIAAGMTQEGLGVTPRVKPQQVQRYEATEFASASLPDSESSAGSRAEHARARGFARRFCVLAHHHARDL